MTKRTIFISITAVATALIGLGFLYSKNPSYAKELDGVFCEELSDPQSYKKKSLDHFAMLIEGKGGWIFRTHNDFRNDWSVKPETLDYLKQLDQAFKKRNAELVLVIPPVRGMVHADRLSRIHKKTYLEKDVDTLWSDYNAMIAAMNGTGVTTVGIDQSNTKDGNFFYKRNHHWSAYGAREMAKAAAEKISILPVYQSIEKQEFVTKEAEEEQYRSSFKSAFRKICSSKVPDETIQYYVTELIQSTNNESSLFGDKSSNNIFLIGTSNSINDSSKANFEGFLREYLSSDITNNAITGAGIDSSVISFIQSKAFQNNEPKIVIWEVPGYYDLNIMDDKIFNQIIPAAYGQCESPKLQKQMASIKANTKTTIFTPQEPQIIEPEQAEEASSEEENNSDNVTQEQPMTPTKIELVGNDYIHIMFDKPVRHSFSLRFVYEDGGVKKQNFSRDKSFPVDRNFYTKLPTSKDIKTLKAIEIYSKKKPLPSAQYSICSQ